MHGIRSLVSKKKRRFQESGFDLDLSYVNDRIIAMGFPAEKLEGMYRNHRDEVYRFLEERHKDHYKLYNLCSERHYDTTKFHNRVVRYPFDDHNAPPFGLIEEFCKDMHDFLNESPENVAVVHCKAGKGRTGVMISSYLLYSGEWSTAAEALKFFAASRTEDLKGVTIPSQNRYVNYFDRYLKDGLLKMPIFSFKAIRFHTIPNFDSSGGCEPKFRIYSNKQVIYQSKVYQRLQQSDHEIMEFPIEDITVSGDVKVDFYHKETFSSVEMFHFWFNTAFVDPNNAVFTRVELDKAHKEKRKKYFDPNFKLELVLSTVGYVEEGALATSMNRRITSGSSIPRRTSTIDNGGPTAPLPQLEKAFKKLNLDQPPSLEDAVLSSQEAQDEPAQDQLDSRDVEKVLHVLESSLDQVQSSLEHTNKEELVSIQKSLANLPLSAPLPPDADPAEEVGHKLSEVLLKARQSRSFAALKGASGILHYVAMSCQKLDPDLELQVKLLDQELSLLDSDASRVSQLREISAQNHTTILERCKPPTPLPTLLPEQLQAIRAWCNILYHVSEKLKTVFMGSVLHYPLSFESYKVPRHVEQEDDDEEEEEGEEADDTAETKAYIDSFNDVGGKVHTQLVRNLSILISELQSELITLEQAKSLASIFIILGSPSS
eukprot:TRINITY_DN222_c1_g1_i1.p1 TRINITY_DN222_c1_g1~~TRINITY_DN222_c1_g1_i1.p1  ORF type:complete len:658 (+),score=128.41 TRINITY_DN222_c1_g1_i1:58-2031(+)